MEKYKIKNMTSFFKTKEPQTLFHLLEDLDPDRGDLIFLLHRSCEKYGHATCGEPHLLTLKHYLESHKNERLVHYQEALYREIKAKNIKAAHHLILNKRQRLHTFKLLVEKKVCLCELQQKEPQGCPLETPIILAIESYEQILDQSLNQLLILENLEKKPIIEQIGPSLSFYPRQKWEKRLLKDSKGKNLRDYLLNVDSDLESFIEDYYNKHNTMEIPIFSYFPEHQTGTNNLRTVRLSLHYTLTNLYREPTPEEGAFYYRHCNSHHHLLHHFMDQLVRHQYLPKNSSFHDFGKFWRGQIPPKPIIWLGTVGELRFLLTYPVQTLHVIERSEQHHWDFAARFFRLPNGERITKEQLRKGHAPKNTAKLEAICRVLVPQ